MEEATGAPSSFAALSPRRLRASSRDGGGVVNRPPSSPTMLFSRHTRRREVVAGLSAAGAAGALPGGVWAQPAENVHRLGALLPAAQVARSFREATVPELARLGFVEGRNLVIDARLAPSDQMPVAAAELARSNPDAILAVGGEAIAASIAASDTIPVVMYGADALLRDPDLPLSRSRGNATGFAILGPELDIKRLEILREAVPMAARIGVLVQPSTPKLKVECAISPRPRDTRGLSRYSFRRQAQEITRRPSQRFEQPR
jgi:hypothetical protein